MESGVKVGTNRRDEMSAEDKDLTLTVGTPNGSFTADFPKTAKVSEVIAAAIKEKGLQGGADAFQLFKGKEQLAPPERPLVSFHLADGDKLLLAATGSGV
jgi:hypothetical protein